MGSTKLRLKHVLKLSISIYVLLLLFSHIFLLVSKKENFKSTDLKLINSELSVLYFDDPILNDINDESFQNFNLLNVTYEHPDSLYSHKRIAQNTAHILDSLDVESVHVIGKGIGGSTAIHFVSQFPDLSKSLSLIDANGIVELELLGGYHLNHAVYGAKLSFLKIIDYLVPHFGLIKDLDSQILSSKIQFESDQRLIRESIKSISIPVLIQHTQNSNVSIQVAKEFQRLIPQSDLRVYEKVSSIVESDLIEFISNQNFTNKHIQVNDERIAQSLLPFDEKNALKAEGKALLILMLVIVLSTLISEDLTCIGTGLMIARGLIGFWPGTFACLVGIFFGDILLYLAGRWLASSTLHKAPFKWFINEKDIQKSYHWFEAKGPAIIIASRFIPGTRLPTYFSAGAIGAKFWMFILYFGVASIIWTPILVGLAVLLGKQMMTYFGLYQEYALWVLIGVLSIAFILFKVIIPMFTFRGRRILIGKWKRLTNWEFWNPIIPYSFIMIYVLFLWIKHKSITVFTLANLSIPEGGFIKESKRDILDKINARESVARYTFLSNDQNNDLKLSTIESFMDEFDLEFPIVIKPDVGERGRGVFIPKSKKEVEDLIDVLKSDQIIQEYIGGEEYGVFYYRYPNDKEGSIFSITKKVYLKIFGNGVHTLEELILKDKRAVCLAELHFDTHINQLYDIPKNGEEIKLVDLGTHSRGSIFYDGFDLITPELSREIDRISKSFDGFYFGRFDIKVPSKNDLLNGENIKVIELNGVTSESTNIYDPKYSFFYGQKVLREQWEIAYEIGSQNKVLNPELKSPTIFHLLNLLR